MAEISAWEMSKRTRSERNSERRFRERESLKPSLRSVLDSNREARRANGARTPRSSPRRRGCQLFA